ncbi:MAG: hypothetical protein HY698_09670 [Deltaproteobacteria bacterium]|nr:hypothetical protein [Deltaproteobacteria bacterium]
MISISRPLHAEACFFVLSHLELGRDAASLHDRRRKPKPWSPSLLSAYREAPGRLVIHALPLWAPSWGEMTAALTEHRLPTLRDSAGKRLAAVLLEALEVERPAVESSWLLGRRRAQARATEFEAHLPGLGRARNALWGEIGRAPPELEILDCASLETRGGTHGRGALHPGRHAIAVSLSAPLEQVACQVLHEAVHPVTDPSVRARFRGVPQDTREGTSGFALHLALEEAAIHMGQRLVELHIPRLLPAYLHWRHRHGR